MTLCADVLCSRRLVTMEKVRAYDAAAAATHVQTTGRDCKEAIDAMALYEAVWEHRPPRDDAASVGSSGGGGGVADNRRMRGKRV